MAITKVVIHSLDAENKRMLFSERVLNLSQHQEVEALISKLFKSFKNSASTSRALLNETSKFREVLNTKFDFLDTTQTYAKTIFMSRLMGEIVKDSNMVFAQIDEQETTYLLCMEMKSRPAYIKTTEVEQGVENSLKHNMVVLSDTFTSVETGFNLDLSTGELKVKTSIENEELVMEALDCQIIANTKNAFSVVSALVSSISESRQEERTPHILKAKQVLSDHMTYLEEIESKDLLSAVYEDLNDEELSLIDSTLEEHLVQDNLILNDLKRGSIISKHKIVTESGIEIIIPVGDVNIDSILDIVYNEQGQVSIHLNNIGKIIS